MDKTVIWSHIKTLRLEYLRNNVDLKCEKSFIPEEKILDNFEKLSQLIMVNISDEIDGNITKSEINVGAEKFLTLNSCPSNLVRLYWKAIYGPKSRIAMLASNIIKKADKDFKTKAIKIFAKISQVLGFKHIYYQHKENGNMGKTIELMTNSYDMNVTENHLLQSVRNHPVHILNNEGEFSPSSFIPFCSFGQRFIGDKVKEFEIPVCNIFKPKVLNDQLCYETNLQELKDSNKKILEEQLEIGLTLVLDYNEERQVNFNEVSKDAKKSFYFHDNSVSMFLDTTSII